MTSKSIGLKTAEKICGPAVSHRELKAKVDAVLTDITLG
jgi:hypothetical protein